MKPRWNFDTRDPLKVLDEINKHVSEVLDLCELLTPPWQHTDYIRFALYPVRQLIIDLAHHIETGEQLEGHKFCCTRIWPGVKVTAADGSKVEVQQIKYLARAERRGGGETLTAVLDTEPQQYVELQARSLEEYYAEFVPGQK
jgi:hypothetical protein